MDPDLLSQEAASASSPTFLIFMSSTSQGSEFLTDLKGVETLEETPCSTDSLFSSLFRKFQAWF